MGINQSSLGSIGESIVSELLDCTTSTDPYDMIKDMVDAQGNNVEVKTQNRYRSKNSFTVSRDHRNQLPKCLNVDRLIFVEYDNTNIVSVWECPKPRSYKTTVTRDGRSIALFNVDSMHRIAHINNPQLASLMLSKSQAALK